MAESYSTLSLGTRQDAATWERGCGSIGLTISSSIRKSSPSIAEMKAFFSSSASWIYFGGHFSGMRLYNEDSTASVTFERTQVTLTSGGTSAVVQQGSSDFNLHVSSRVILWGGCSVCSAQNTMQTMRSLFGKHVLLGFAGLTGWRMVDAMLGGGFLKNHLFTRVKATSTAPADVVQAWMGAAKAGYGGGENEVKFRAVDWDGQEWKLEGNKIIKGRMIG
ncbi:MAG TPA: hypothetical protein VD970_14570 [Acetobacteraceae bacterium]|nr:hypothetical protein [Acetobacteraceae bacterium]